MQSHISTCIKESFCLSSLPTYANIFQVKLVLPPPLILKCTAENEEGVIKLMYFSFRVLGVSQALHGE